jgi:hypothetical protein
LSDSLPDGFDRCDSVIDGVSGYADVVFSVCPGDSSLVVNLLGFCDGPDQSYESISLYVEVHTPFSGVRMSYEFDVPVLNAYGEFVLSESLFHHLYTQGVPKRLTIAFPEMIGYGGVLELMPVCGTVVSTTRSSSTAFSSGNDVHGNSGDDYASSSSSTTVSSSRAHSG